MNNTNGTVVPPGCEIDGLAVPLFRPESVAELADMVRQARGAGEALYPVGGGTMLNLGLPPVKKGRGVQLGRLAAVVDYPARDMTITVQAGITVAELRRVL